MTPKEKAIEIFDKFKIGDVVTEKLQIVNINIYSKLFALITVDEIIKALPPFSYGLEFVAKIEFWNNVKNEIENL